MQFSISGVGNQSQYEKGKDIEAVTVNVRATDTTGATITNAILQGIRVNVVLTRSGQPFTILSGNLYALGISGYPSSMEGISINTVTGDKSFKLDFGEIVNLNGDDTLNVEVQVSSAAAGQVVTVDTIQGVGIAAYIPRVTVYSIDTNQSLQTIGGGDNVQTVALVSDSASVFDLGALQISTSGRYSQSFTTQTFFSLIASQWERTPENLSFHLYNGSQIDGVQINTNNVASASNTWVVVYGGVIDPLTVQRANIAAEKVVNEAQQKFTPLKK